MYIVLGRVGSTSTAWMAPATGLFSMPATSPPWIGPGPCSCHAGCAVAFTVAREIASTLVMLPAGMPCRSKSRSAPSPPLTVIVPVKLAPRDSMSIWSLPLPPLITIASTLAMRVVYAGLPVAVPFSKN